jgi:hypothetical protein
MQKSLYLKTLSLMAISCLLSPTLAALEEANQPSGLDFPSYKLAWLFSNDKEQNQALYKALNSLAYEKLSRSSETFESYAEKKLKKIDDFYAKRFNESIIQSDRDYEKAFFVLATPQALKQWAEGASLNKLILSSSSYEEIDQPLLGTLKYIYFIHPQTIVFPYQGDWYFADEEEIKAINEHLKKFAKRNETSYAIVLENIVFKPSESKESIEALSTVLTSKGQEDLKKSLLLFNEIAPINGDNFTVYFIYYNKEQLNPEFQKSIESIEQKFKVISRFIKRSGALNNEDNK